MLPVIQVGPLAVQTPGLILILGLWLGLSLAEKQARRHTVDPNAIYNMFFVALIAGVIGARAAYVLQHPAAFSSSLISVISLNPGLLDSWGGLITGGLAGLIYGQRQKLSLWPTLDALTPLVAVFSLALGLAHLASGQAYGTVTTLPWGIDLWGARRHPWQVYEIAAAALATWLTWPKSALQPGAAQPNNGWFLSATPPGMRFLTFTAIMAGVRLFIEAFRADGDTIGPVKTAQIAAWLILAFSLWLLHKRRRPFTAHPTDAPIEGDNA